VLEPQYRSGSHRIRPFVQEAGVHHRQCSRPLQRAVTDFGADIPYAKVVDKLEEHYGVSLDESTIRRVTQAHAQQIWENEQAQEVSYPEHAGTKDVVIVEMDGGMVPIMEPSPEQKDQRRGKKLHWKEAKIGLSHRHGSIEMAYCGTVQGDAAEAGKKLLVCAGLSGMGKDTPIHAVGDGAPWLADQVEQQFGTQATYLVDFYHVCEYLSAAATAIEPDKEQALGWVEEQKQRLKSGRADEVLDALEPVVEADDLEDKDAPVRCCYRYLSHRRGQLDYASALKAGLPIGSGEIESAHRYVVQKRLKLPGAWWRAANADYMVALRVCRLNGQWGAYWSTTDPPMAA
jgi:hypothetical protein